MTDNAKKFMEKVSNDEALQAELTAAVKGLGNMEQIPAVIEFAKKKGYELTKEDFVQDDKDINLDELETVSGGGGCGCALAGGGGGDELECACFGAGGGGIGKHSPSSQGGCVCAMAGAGATRRH